MLLGCCISASMRPSARPHHRTALEYSQFCPVSAYSFPGPAASHVKCQRLRAFVGESTAGAGEYHECDFPWETCIPDGLAAIERQRLELEALRAAGAALHRESDGASWEAFHQLHSGAKFFKEKRYLPLAFPVLRDDRGPGGSLHVAEIGCGCGSAILPVLKANPAVKATVCDVSATAVDLLKQAAQRAGIEASRVNAFAFDASQAQEGGPLSGLNADCVLMIFTLSALSPADMPAMLNHARCALRPGGLLLFRDYGRWDMAQLRFSGAHLVDPDSLVYRRTDGTLSSFFDPEELKALVQRCEFEVEDCRYVTTLVRNKKKDLGLKRVFVHGAFRRPG